MKHAYDTLCFLMEHPKVQGMKEYRHHKHTNTYNHCRHVALKSLWIIRHARIKTDMEALIRGAMLHDFYLYEATSADITGWKHGRTHPMTALGNAEKEFTLSRKEKNIIYSHMWPLCITHIPKCREAVIVCIADKWCAIEELFLWKKKKAS